MNKQDLRSVILEYLFRNGSFSRPEIVEITGMRPGTVFDEVNQLKQQGCILEPARAGKYTGRKAPALTLNPDYLWTAGIDFQVHRTIGVVTDFTGQIQYSAEVSAVARKNLTGCRNEVREILQQLHAQTGKSWEKIRGIGFADPGLVDVSSGKSIRAVQVPGWEDIETGKWLAEENRLASGVWPECMIKTFMEYQVRAGKNVGSLFHVGMDDGIGGGYISRNGECFTGDTNQAMEIGHIVIDPEGPLCQCGSRGCLEAIAGKKGISRKIREMINNGVDTVMKLDSEQNFDLHSFGEWAQYDKAARIIAGDVSRSIGQALAAAVTLLNPSIIVFSGELTSLGSQLIDPVREMLNNNCFSGVVKDLKIELSTLNREDTARGAAILMRNKLMKNEEF